ncbi:Chemotaxis protein methyltransferase [Hartmannibacter diazotrophicus]|uniref:Chemotaxis protein methyltransferase n=1 Tax=Hartmannibacter diazotrophicus TaxID=1482074 RepID=A0A2C9DDM2_9HYPH|nr:protein-glutamate O-methyltransferase CheR [Hartmannibacter diazotrophicus]SON58259.1 Chemotaxis protein methyltransferase [Hartmannibacter diazotrophicus]
MTVATTSYPSHEEMREFPFTIEDFRFLAALVHENTGIVLSDHKMNMVYSRLARRLRELRLLTFEDYCARLRGSEAAAELGMLINAITTNLTRFFREPHHFDHLGETALAPFADARAGTRLRVWSAGCSSGEEPYSIAMTMAETLPNLRSLDARLLATDLDTRMVAHGRAGLYAEGSVGNLEPARREKWMRRDGASMRIVPSLADLIAFKQLNLLGPWPMKGPFDAIFCRNVMIYFDNPTKERLVERFWQMLKPDGFLYIGHSETLLDQRDIFVPAGRTIYRRVG